MGLGRYLVIWHLVLTSIQSSDVISRTFCKQNTIGCGSFTITCQEGVIAIEQVLYQHDKYCDSITDFEQRVNCCCVDSIANDTTAVGFATDDINKTCHGEPSCNLNVFMNNKPGKITIEYTCEVATPITTSPTTQTTLSQSTKLRIATHTSKTTSEMSSSTSMRSAFRRSPVTVRSPMPETSTEPCSPTADAGIDRPDAVQCHTIPTRTGLTVLVSLFVCLCVVWVLTGFVIRRWRQLFGTF